MPGSFVHRRINVSFSLGLGSTGLAGLSNSTLIGKRISAKIIVPGPGIAGSCSLQIYGMPLSDMNALAKTGWIGLQQKNSTVLVEAGDDQNGMSEVFAGNIIYAWPDMTNMPQVVMRIEAQTGSFDGVKPAQVTSFKGPTPFMTAAQSIVQKFANPRTLETTGINKMLDSPYFYGSALSQFKSLAKAARVAWVDENQRTIAAWPMQQSRPGGGTLISKETGMVADPIGTPNGILVRQLFSKPYKYGTAVTVQCIITPANGSWSIAKLEYSLESEMPHGEWFTTITAIKIGGGGG
jgi:hypothetical protein